MYVYSGIDEAGYGPMYGPLAVGAATLVLPDWPDQNKPPAMWELLSSVVCDRLQGRRGRIAINDSKKLTTKAAGIKHLELGLLAFLGLDEQPPPADVSAWLNHVGETRHQASAGDGLAPLPWYAPHDDRPWQPLPNANTHDELSIARSMLTAACRKAGVTLGSIGVQVVYEDHFNHRVALTRSKASVSFTCVARHLSDLMHRYGEHRPHVAVDRQSGRMRYRDLLAQLFDGARIDVLGETAQTSAYRIDAGGRGMTVSFMVGAEQRHMPVALASMAAKYTRELLMQRFNTYFAGVVADVNPTAGYGTDANRWRDQMLPHLTAAGIDHQRLRRLA